MTAKDILFARDVKRCEHLIRLIKSGQHPYLTANWQLELETIKNRYGGIIPQPHLDKTNK